MNYRYFIFFILALCTIACKNDTLHEKEGKNSFLNSTYKTSFEPLPSKYISQKQQLIDAFFEENINTQDFNGSFLVAQNGQIIFEKYQGYANFSTSKKITKNTPLHIASISKVLTANVIMRMIDANKFSLDTKIKQLLPMFPFETITIKMLLNHRSGLPKYGNFSEPEDIWGKTKTLHNQDILNLMVKHQIPLDFNPDTKFSYCNTNYAILALVIEKVSKMSYPKAMKALLFDPLGMKNTFVLDFENQKDTVSQSYKSTQELIRYDQLDAVYGDKNIYSTPQDLLRFDLATYSKDFLSESLQKQVYQGYSYEKKGVKNYGLGIRLREWETGQKIHYHNGWWHGSTSTYITLKKDSVTIIGISNKYTRKIYQAMRLTALFGDYPFKLTNEESLEE